MMGLWGPGSLTTPFCHFVLPITQRPLRGGVGFRDAQTLQIQRRLLVSGELGGTRPLGCVPGIRFSQGRCE